MNASSVSTIALLTLTVVGCSPDGPHETPDGVQRIANASELQLTGTYRFAGEGSTWRPSPYMRAWYDMTVAAFARGPDIDVDAYEKEVFEIFREFGRAEGIGEEAMVGHLKLLPRQMIDIIQQDPDVLQTYDDFWTAVAGPD